MKHPTISVIMTFRNCENYLNDAISSIINQTFSDFELIIVNDASTDNSDEIVQKYLYDKRIIYIRNTERKYAGYNANQCLKIARGQYIARMDGDDISTLDRFEKQIIFLNEHPEIDIVSGYACLIDSNGNSISILEKPTDHLEIRKKIFYYFSVIHGAALIRKTVYDNVGGYLGKYMSNEDTHWTYKAILLGGYNATNLPEVFLYYRQHEHSISHNHVYAAKIGFRIKKDIIARGYKPTLFERFTMYYSLLFGLIFNNKFQSKIYSILKKII